MKPLLEEHLFDLNHAQITFLARHKETGKVRLMLYNCNPWLPIQKMQVDQPKEEDEREHLWAHNLGLTRGELLMSRKDVSMPPNMATFDIH
jgi:hypothetical protein